MRCFLFSCGYQLYRPLWKGLYFRDSALFKSSLIASKVVLSAIISELVTAQLFTFFLKFISPIHVTLYLDRLSEVTWAILPSYLLKLYIHRHNSITQYTILFTSWNIISPCCSFFSQMEVTSNKHSADLVQASWWTTLLMSPSRAPNPYLLLRLRSPTHHMPPSYTRHTPAFHTVQMHPQGCQYCTS